MRTAHKHDLKTSLVVDPKLKSDIVRQIQEAQRPLSKTYVKKITFRSFRARRKILKLGKRPNRRLSLKEQYLNQLHLLNTNKARGECRSAQ